MISRRAAQRDALRRATEAEDDPSWQCTQCGTPHINWRAACTHCNATATLAWRSPTPTPGAITTIAG